MSCPYVLRFDGVFYRNDVPAIVMPWIPNGNITEYLHKNPDADRLRLVSSNIPPSPATAPHLITIQLLCVVKAVKYLHSCNIVHGDVKAVTPPFA